MQIRKFITLDRLRPFLQREKTEGNYRVFGGRLICSYVIAFGGKKWDREQIKKKKALNPKSQLKLPMTVILLPIFVLSLCISSQHASISLSDCPSVLPSFLFFGGECIAQAGLEYTMLLKLASNSWQFLGFSLPGVGITGMGHHVTFPPCHDYTMPCRNCSPVNHFLFTLKLEILPCNYPYILQHASNFYQPEFPLASALLIQSNSTSSVHTFGLI